MTRAILLSVLACPTACVASRRRCARLRDAARLIRRGGAAAAGETGAAVMPPIDEEYDLLLTEDFGGGGGGGAGFPSHNGDDETLLYPTLASTSSTMPKTDTKKAFFLLGLIGAVADLDRRAFFVVVAVTNLYAMRFMKTYVRPSLTKWMCCNTQLLDSGFARTIRSERTITRPEVDTFWDLLKSKNKPTTAASERADPCEKWLDQCGR